MYAAMRLVKNLELDNGFKVTLEADGQMGMIPVFETKKRAREVYGNDVSLIPIGIDEEAAKP